MREKIKKMIENEVASKDAASKDTVKMWRTPLVAFMSARDDRLGLLRKLVGPEHLMPGDVLPGAQSLISFFIPFSEEVVESNKDESAESYASELWAKAYIETNKLIASIAESIEKLTGDAGYKVGKIPATHNFHRKTLISDFSHRHVAYFAGLGTFGLNNMLITEAGCCGRLGTIITDCDLGPFARFSHQEKCAGKHGVCGVCIKQCPVNAYGGSIFKNSANSSVSYDRFACYDRCMENSKKYETTGDVADVCGKCLVNLPCSMKCP